MPITTAPKTLFEPRATPYFVSTSARVIRLATLPVSGTARISATRFMSKRALSSNTERPLRSRTSAIGVVVPHSPVGQAHWRMLWSRARATVRLGKSAPVTCSDCPSISSRALNKSPPQYARSQSAGAPPIRKKINMLRASVASSPMKRNAGPRVGHHTTSPTRNAIGPRVTSCRIRPMLGRMTISESCPVRVSRESSLRRLADRARRRLVCCIASPPTSEAASIGRWSNRSPIGLLSLAHGAAAAAMKELDETFTGRLRESCEGLLSVRYGAGSRNLANRVRLAR